MALTCHYSSNQHWKPRDTFGFPATDSEGKSHRGWSRSSSSKSRTAPSKLLISGVCAVSRSLKQLAKNLGQVRLAFTLFNRAYREQAWYIRNMLLPEKHFAKLCAQDPSQCFIQEINRTGLLSLSLQHFPRFVFVWIVVGPDSIFLRNPRHPWRCFIATVDVETRLKQATSTRDR